MNELALFAGAGGGILGGHILGWRTVCAVERDAYPAQVLAARQNDGTLPPFPIWSDVCSFDGRPWCGIAQIVSGGFPCTDISSAGRGAGIEGEHSGLWSEFARIIGQVRPEFVFVENSDLLNVRGLERVLGDLATLGFDAEWCVLGANHAGAPHERQRTWILAHAIGGRWGQVFPGGETQGRKPHPDQRSPQLPHPDSNEHEGRPHARGRQGQEARAQVLHDPLRGRYRAPDGEIRPGWDALELPGWWATEPALGRVAHGVAYWVDRIRALGNGQVPVVAVLAFLTLYSRLIQGKGWKTFSHLPWREMITA